MTLFALRRYQHSVFTPHKSGDVRMQQLLATLTRPMTVEELAARMECTTTLVRKYAKELQNLGLITITIDRPHKQRQRMVYQRTIARGGE